MTKYAAPAAFAEKPYRHIALTPIESNQVQAIGYHPGTQTLAVTFTRGPGNVYHYPNVLPETYAAFISADSKGKFFGDAIKPLPFEKYPAPEANWNTPAGAAWALDGALTYPVELTKEQQNALKAAGLVIVYGASDDLIEFEGAFRDEGGCYEGGEFLVDASGLLPSWESASEDEQAAADYLARKAKARTIKANWSDSGVSWTYTTDIPHSTFIVKEDGEPDYCVGIVFALADL